MAPPAWDTAHYRTLYCRHSTPTHWCTAHNLQTQYSIVNSIVMIRASQCKSAALGLIWDLCFSIWLFPPCHLIVHFWKMKDANQMTKISHQTPIPSCLTQQPSPSLQTCFAPKLGWHHSAGGQREGGGDAEICWSASSLFIPVCSTCRISGKF